MLSVRKLQRIGIVTISLLGLIFVVLLNSFSASRSQESYSLDSIIYAYDTGQVRAIITSGTQLTPSADGAYIYARSDGLYRVSDGEFIGAYPSAYFSPDGTHLAQREVGVYRLSDMVLRFATHNHVVFSEDGTYFAVDGDGVYRISDLTRVSHIPAAQFAFSDDSRLVATSQGRVYYLSDPDHFVDIVGISEEVVPFISPDGRFAWARNATLIDIDSGIVVSPTLNVVRFTPNGRWAIVSGIGIFDLSSDSQGTPAIDLTGITNITLSPLGLYFAIPQGIFRLSDGEQLIDTQHLNLPQFTFAPDDTSVVINGDGLYRLEPLELLHELQGFGDYHANGRYVATDDRIVRTSDGNVVFEAEDGRFPTLMMNTDGSLIAFVRDGVYVFETGERLFSVDGLMRTFSVGSTYLAFRGREETAIYRIPDGRRYEGLEPLYTERGLLNVGQVVFVVDSSVEQQLQIPFIRVTSEQEFSSRPESVFEIHTSFHEGLYLPVLETLPGWVRVKDGERDLWTQVNPDSILWLPD